MRQRIDALLERLGLTDRRADRAESLSGGLARRVEIAKGLLHDPPVLLLDEPSTGLDPGARLDLWRYLQQLREQSGVTVLVTTHLMEEAERCDRLAILDQGRVVALGSPEELRSSIGGDCLTIPAQGAQALRNPEPNFYILGAKSYGRNSNFLLRTGFEQVREAFTLITGKGDLNLHK